ncbi:helix-turn-helix domain-containing protein [Flavobacterium sp. JP2137]|uniref:helix-turn-helix domain-containing protein n=1 Tax=Flavobacterium sp. JP2137 TaxID=3414510 RepID=UPI003D2FF23C
MFSMAFELLLYVLFIVGFLNLLLERLIIHQKYERSTWTSMVFFTMILVHSIWGITMTNTDASRFVFGGFPFTLFYIPLFLFSIRAAWHAFLKVELLYFIPAIFFMTLYTLINFNLADDVRIKHYYFIMLGTVNTVAMGGFFFYGFICVLKGSIQRIKLKYLVFICIVYWTVYTTMFLSFLILDLNFERDAEIWNLISYAFLLLVAVFLTVEKILFLEEKTNYIAEVQELNLAKYAKSKKSEAELNVYRAEVEKLLKEEVFLIHDLALEDVSKQLKIPKHYLTQVFSFTYKANFKQIINKHRVLYASRLIVEELNMERIDDIAFNSGFSSKTSFYRAFKSEFNCTPLEFKRKQGRYSS